MSNPTNNDIKVVTAKALTAVTSAATTYNGAAVASANGIDVRGKGFSLAVINLGAIGASQTGVDFSFACSALSTNPAADIEEITASKITVLPADAASTKVMRIDNNKLTADKRYLYIKRVQATADSVADDCIVLLTDGNVKPAGQTFASDVK